MKTYTNKLTNETYRAIRIEKKAIDKSDKLETISGIVFEVLETKKEKFLTDHEIHKLAISNNLIGRYHINDDQKAESDKN